MDNMNDASPQPATAPRCGAVTLVGRPNAGKSTLMNRWLAEKLAIVSDKPQTTRQRIVGILSAPQGQIVFYDTPGVHRAKHGLNRRMMKAAQAALYDADVVCLLVDAGQPFGSGDRFLLDWVAKAEVPKLVLLNKIDLVAKPSLLPRIARYAEQGCEEIVPISARTGDGTDRALEILWSHLPAGPPRYDHELLTIHPERFLVAERIREKVLEQTREELPFSTTVIIDSWEEREDRDLVTIQATILAERAGQKKILIGSGGQRIKAIGMAARQDLEAFLERRVYLDLAVRIEANWRENRHLLDQLDRDPFAAEGFS